MVRKDVVIVHLMYQRQVSGITSFLSVPLELRKNWITSLMVVGMARMVEEFRDLRGWELVCYYYDNATE